MTRVEEPVPPSVHPSPAAGPAPGARGAPPAAPPMLGVVVRGGAPPLARRVRRLLARAGAPAAVRHAATADVAPADGDTSPPDVILLDAPPPDGADWPALAA